MDEICDTFDPMDFYEQSNMSSLDLPSKEVLDEMFFKDFLTDESQKREFFDGFAADSLLLTPEEEEEETQKEVETTVAPSSEKEKEVKTTTPIIPAAPRNKRKKSEQEQVDRRRELNRKNARKSRLRQKFKVESLILRVAKLEEENKSLREVCKVAEAQGIENRSSVIVKKILREGDYSLMESLTRSASTFCLSDPNQTDNPIVFASNGFFNMTGYTHKEVIGKNCRFLQGPGTNPETVQKIRQGLEKNEDVAVTILNYRKDGSTFWNQLFIAPLMGKNGTSVVHYVGVQREITVKTIPYSVLKLVKLNREKSEKLAKGKAIQHENIPDRKVEDDLFQGFDGQEEIALLQGTKN